MSLFRRRREPERIEEEKIDPPLFTTGANPLDVDPAVWVERGFYAYRGAVIKRVYLSGEPLPSWKIFRSLGALQRNEADDTRRTLRAACEAIDRRPR